MGFIIQISYGVTGGDPSVKTRSLRESFRCAIEGVLYVLETERNMMLHFSRLH